MLITSKNPVSSVSENQNFNYDTNDKNMRNAIEQYRKPHPASIDDSSHSKRMKESHNKMKYEDLINFIIKLLLAITVTIAFFSYIHRAGNILSFFHNTPST
jgi:hypothetical protein